MIYSIYANSAFPKYFKDFRINTTQPLNHSVSQIYTVGVLDLDDSIIC